MLAFSQDEVEAFARLSGDFNPIHIDPEFARNEMFGQSIVHGVFTMLRAIDAYLQQAQVSPSISIACLNVKFLKPVFVDTPVSLVVDGECLNPVLRLFRGELELMLVSLALEVGVGSDSDGSAAVESGGWEPRAPDVGILSEGDHKEGPVALKLDDATARALFPELAVRCSRACLAELLAYSRVVGMSVPGRDSLISKIHIEAKATDVPPAYRMTRYDQRFQSVNLSLVGPCFEGRVMAFVRPESVIVPVVPPAGLTRNGAKVLADQRALVIGGSRGIGAATASLLAARGARVTLTWHHHEAACRERVAQMREAGFEAEACQYDVARGDFPGKGAFDRVYYFATPRIFRQRTQFFDDALFAEFKAYYVDYFINVVNRFPEAEFFYPSSVALDDFVPELLEYAAAKHAGELVCRELMRKGHRIVVKRLPRIHTDQTLAVGAAKGADPFEVMAELI